MSVTAFGDTLGDAVHRGGASHYVWGIYFSNDNILGWGSESIWIILKQTNFLDFLKKLIFKRFYLTSILFCSNRVIECCTIDHMEPAVLEDWLGNFLGSARSISTFSVLSLEKTRQKMSKLYCILWNATSCDFILLSTGDRHGFSSFVLRNKTRAAVKERFFIHPSIAWVIVRVKQIIVPYNMYVQTIFFFPSLN